MKWSKVLWSPAKQGWINRPLSIIWSCRTISAWIVASRATARCNRKWGNCSLHHGKHRLKLFCRDILLILLSTHPQCALPTCSEWEKLHICLPLHNAYRVGLITYCNYDIAVDMGEFGGLVKKKSCMPTTCPNGQPLSQASDTRRYFLIHWDSCGALYIFLFNKRNCIFLDTCILFSSTMGDKQVCAWGQCSRVKKKKKGPAQTCFSTLLVHASSQFIPGNEHSVSSQSFSPVFRNTATSAVP